MSEPAFPGIAGQNGYGNATVEIDANGNTACVEHNQGMSLLDYFAGQALSGMLAIPNRVGRNQSEYAEMAYNYAEAMIKERETRCAARSEKS